MSRSIIGRATFKKDSRIANGPIEIDPFRENGGGPPGTGFSSSPRALR